MATEVTVPREYGLGNTQRRDYWWIGPLATAVGLGLLNSVSQNFRVLFESFPDSEFLAAMLSPAVIRCPDLSQSLVI